jgi:hypothetical protein
LAQSAPAPSPVRRTAIFGAVAALGVAASLFVAWVEIDPAVAERFLAKVEQRLSDPDLPVVPRADDWRRLARIVAEEHTITGVDVFFWARTASASGLAQEGSLGERRGARAILLLAILLAVLALGGLLLGLHFLRHRFRRVRSPVLILCVVLGGIAVGLSALYGIVQGAVDAETEGAWGLQALRACGAVLLLAGAFGVKAVNWWRVYGGALLTLAAIGIVSWQFVTKGFGS